MSDNAIGPELSAFLDKRIAAEADRDRLRAALERIAHQARYEKDASEIARAALAGAERGEVPASEAHPTVIAAETLADLHAHGYSIVRTHAPLARCHCGAFHIDGTSCDVTT